MFSIKGFLFGIFDIQSYLISLCGQTFRKLFWTFKFGEFFKESNGDRIFPTTKTVRADSEMKKIVAKSVFMATIMGLGKVPVKKSLFAHRGLQSWFLRNKSHFPGRLTTNSLSLKGNIHNVQEEGSIYCRRIQQDTSQKRVPIYWRF